MVKPTKPIIWIIDSQHWPRANLRAELIERGFEVVGYINPAHALAAFRYPRIERPHFIILELCDLPLERHEIEAMVRIGVPIILLGGSTELNQKLIREFQWAAILQRPFTIGTVADAVEKLVRDETQEK